MAENATDPTAPASPGTRARPPVRFPVVLEGQPALVTGANSGIGRAVALGLAASGADVVVNYVVDPAAAEDVAHQIEALGRKAITVKADVSNEEDVRSMCPGHRRVRDAAYRGEQRGTATRRALPRHDPRAME